MQDPGDLIVVLAPVLRRPWAAGPLAESLRETTTAGLLFLCSPGDDLEIAACCAVAQEFPRVQVEVVPFEQGPGDYARKINHGVRVTEEEWIFQAADDLRFHPGWVEAALRASERRGLRRVVGTNDLCNPRVMRGNHSTHSLVHRSYVEEVGTVDEPGKLLHEGYTHNFVDDELVKCASFRREFVHAPDSIVEHLHPMCGKGDLDSVYEGALERQVFQNDGILSRQRRRVWRPRRR